MNVLVVHCHPVADSFVASARDRVLRTLHRTGHVVRVTDLYAEEFDPCFDAHDRRTHLEPGTVPALERHAADLRWCDSLVLVYPTWWSGQPAMLKGWIDRVWGCGVAWDLPEGASVIRPRLADLRRIAIVTTHGSSKFVNALEGESGKRTAFRSIRAACSRRARTSWTAIYGLDRADDAKRTAWLDHVERRFNGF